MTSTITFMCSKTAVYLKIIWSLSLAHFIVTEWIITKVRLHINSTATWQMWGTIVGWVHVFWAACHSGRQRTESVGCFMTSWQKLVCHICFALSCLVWQLLVPLNWTIQPENNFQDTTIIMRKHKKMLKYFFLKQYQINLITPGCNITVCVCCCWLGSSITVDWQ